jgi:hypothetical protein
MMADRTLTGDAREQLADAGVKDDDRAAPDARGHDDERNPTPRDRGGAGDAGRTSGGGSQGHKQPRDVTDAAPIRNNPSS